MYDKLVKRLRTAAEWAEKGAVILPSDCKEAADAIEELRKMYLDSEVDNTNLTGWLAEEHAKHLWIPVAERLPEILHTVIVSGRMKYEWETDFYQFVDVAVYTEGEFFETFNDWYEGQDEFEITHWKPLPEPPKEEATDG